MVETIRDKGFFICGNPIDKIPLSLFPKRAIIHVENLFRKQVVLWIS